jgi:hypothetical protein
MRPPTNSCDVRVTEIMEMLNLNLHSAKARKSYNPTKPCNPSNRETGPLPALGRVRPLLVIWVLVAMCGGCVPLHARAEDVRFLDNGEVRIGIDLAIGGAITHFGRSGTDENLINSHDLRPSSRTARSRHRTGRGWAGIRYSRATTRGTSPRYWPSKRNGTNCT